MRPAPSSPYLLSRITREEHRRFVFGRLLAAGCSKLNTPTARPAREAAALLDRIGD
jgi:hypothetical protein